MDLLLGVFLFCFGTAMGTVLAISICTGSSLVDDLHEQADGLRGELQTLEQENLELRQKLEGEWWDDSWEEPEEDPEEVPDEGEWWKTGEPNPLGECNR